MTALKEAFVGIDAAKLRNAVAIADAGRDGEIRYIGEVDASLDSMKRLIRKLASKYERLNFCYEAGPTGYGLQRLITELGHSCMVTAPSLIPRKPSDRVKTNRRDATALARLLRAGELTAVWVPDPAHEAMRNLIDPGQPPSRRSGCITAGERLASASWPDLSAEEDLGCPVSMLASAAVFRTSRRPDRPAGICRGGSDRRGTARSHRARHSGVPARMGRWRRLSMRFRPCAASTWWWP